MSLGREALNWDERTWAAIDHAVHEENVRAGVAAKVIPLRGPAAGGGHRSGRGDRPGDDDG